MNSQDLQNAAAKLAPPVAYMGVRLMGVSLPDWVALATLIYIVAQTAHLIWRWRRQARSHSAADQ